MKGIVLIRKAFIVLLIAILIAAVPGAGALAMTAGASDVADTPAGYDVTNAGAKGNDSEDDTQAIQNALDSADSVFIPNGTYYINVDRALHLRSNQTLALSDGATLQALPSARGNYSVIDISGVSNVDLTGGRIIGDRAVHLGSTGEWGMGILVENGSRNIAISNITVSGCWGDGIYLGGASTVSNIRLNGVTGDSNRRQGLSITNATQVTVTGCVFKNTQGTAPEAGIDIEPNDGNITTDITITNTQCTGNAGSGLELFGGSVTVRNIAVSGCQMSGNLGAGVRVSNAGDLQLSNTVITGNYTGIEIPRDAFNVKCSGVTISGNKSRGISLVTSSQATGVSNVIFESTIFSDNSQNQANDTDGIRIDRLDSSGYIKEIRFVGCQFVDRQSAKTQRYGLTVGFSGGLSNIVVDESCIFSGNISGDYLGGGALIVA